PDREMEITGAIAGERMADLRTKALQKMREAVEIPGFRKGNAPEALVAQKVGEMRLLEEASEIALSEEYPNILEEHNIDAIGRPHITITKLAPGNDLEFKIKTALAPEVKLSDYKKIARQENSKPNESIAVTDKEVDDVIEEVRKNSKETPEITDDIKSNIKGNILREKELKAKDKKRTDILEEIIKTSTIEIPNIIIGAEQEKMLAQFKDDISRSGVSYEEYLQHIKKTEADLKTEWKDIAVNRAKSQIILNTIAKEENISPKEEEIKKETDHIVEHYKDADRFRVRMYVETFLTNELVFQFLESQK